MPTVVRFILGCFDLVKELGGPKRAKKQLSLQSGIEGKISFLERFPGIGPKYSRNIMMDVYHPEFRNGIAIDVRVKSISKLLGLTFKDSEYEAHEDFYRDVAANAGLNGWEFDRLIFNFTDELKEKLMATR